MRATLSDETWVPLKWIYTIVGSCIVSVGTLVGAVWYIASLASHEDLAAAQIVDHSKRIEQLQFESRDSMKYLISIDGRLSRIEGALGVERKGK